MADSELETTLRLWWDTALRTSLLAEVAPRPEQAQFLRWAILREHLPLHGVRGGANLMQMGFGKTLSMLLLVVLDKIFTHPHAVPSEARAALRPYADCILRDNDDRAPAATATLVVCPPTLFRVWTTEIDKRFRRSALRYTVIHAKDSPGDAGPRATRALLDPRGALDAPDVVIISYALHDQLCGRLGASDASEDAEDAAAVVKGPDWRMDLRRVRWRRVVFDEAHTHARASARRRSEIAASIKWIVTGTPLTNSEVDTDRCFQLVGARAANRGDDRDLAVQASKGGDMALRQHCEMLVDALAYAQTSDHTPVGLISSPLEHMLRHADAAPPDNRITHRAFLDALDRSLLAVLAPYSAALAQECGCRSVSVDYRRVTRHVGESPFEPFRPQTPGDRHRPHLRNAPAPPHVVYLEARLPRDSLEAATLLLHEEIATDGAGFGTEFQKRVSAYISREHSKKSISVHPLLYFINVADSRIRVEFARAAREHASANIARTPVYVYLVQALDALLSLASKTPPLVAPESPDSAVARGAKRRKYDGSAPAAPPSADFSRRTALLYAALCDIYIPVRIALIGTYLLSHLTHARKCVIFDKNAAPLYLLQQFVSRALNMKTYLVTGASTQLNQRHATFQHANAHNGPCVLLATTDVSGSGIDLTWASDVIFATAWYNNAYAQQCIGRLVRPGQQRSVRVVHAFVESAPDRDRARLASAKDDLCYQLTGIRHTYHCFHVVAPDIVRIAPDDESGDDDVVVIPQYAAVGFSHPCECAYDLLDRD